MAYDIIVGRTESDRKKFGDQGAVLIGKGYVKMGRTTSLSNRIFLDVVRSHVILVCGKRGSGKSYTLGTICEGICNLPEEVSKNIAIVIFDTMGIFWTMKYPNEKDEDLLKQWGLKPEGLNKVDIYIPEGYFKTYKEEGIPADYSFSIKPSELTPEDWRLTFSLDENNPLAIAIEKVIFEFQEKGVLEYSIDDITQAIDNDADVDIDTKNAAKNRFKAAKGWGLFQKEGTKISDMIQGGKISVLDLSAYTTGPGGWGVKNLVTGLIAKKLFIERTLERKKEEIETIKAGYSYIGSEEEYKKIKKPMVWLVIDECLPYNSKVITDKAHTPIGDIVKRFKKGESFKVLGYDVNNQKYGYYDVYHVYEKGKREILEITTETGRKIKTTPNHKVLTDKGFQYALEAKKLATPLNQHYSTNKKNIRARLFGYILGDGWVSKKTKSIGFAGNGNIDNLEKIKEDLLELGFSSSSIHTRKTSSEITTSTGKKLKVNGTSQQLTASVRAFDYFSKLNPPIGKKAHSNFLIPLWLLNATNGEKAEFLAALFGSDGQAPSTNKNVKSDFNAVRLSFYKLEGLENNADEYANQVKKLFNDLDIQVSNIRKRGGNVTKKGENTVRVDLTLAKSVENTVKFLERVGYRYCKEKEDKCKRWLNYLRARQFVVNQRKELRDKALKLHKPGFGKVRIGKKLNLPAYQVREWIYYKTGAGMPKNFPSFEEWTKRKCTDGVIYEEIIEKRELEPELVYDIAVKDVHNFVANDFIVHNCHEFLPEEGKTAATDALITILREGRQPGVSTILATQQPGKIHRDVMTQTDLIISHRVTAKPDVDALNAMMQSYMTSSLVAHLNNLPRESGAAVILDDNSERIYPMRVRPRFTWHGGEAPTAIAYKKKLDLGL